MFIHNVWAGVILWSFRSGGAKWLFDVRQLSTGGWIITQKWATGMKFKILIKNWYSTLENQFSTEELNIVKFQFIIIFLHPLHLVIMTHVACMCVWADSEKETTGLRPVSPLSACCVALLFVGHAWRVMGGGGGGRRTSRGVPRHWNTRLRGAWSGSGAFVSEFHCTFQHMFVWFKRWVAACEQWRFIRLPTSEMNNLKEQRYKVTLKMEESIKAGHEQLNSCSDWDRLPVPGLKERLTELWPAFKLYVCWHVQLSEVWICTSGLQQCNEIYHSVGLLLSA